VFNVFCEPPQITDALLKVKASGNTFKPGSSVDITWGFNEKYTKTIKNIEVWLGHSTGMGHAPTQAIRKNIQPRSGKTKIIIPNIKPSSPGNIWFIDLVWNNNGVTTELNLIPITIINV
jgi:hypothetical protein